MGCGTSKSVETVDTKSKVSPHKNFQNEDTQQSATYASDENTCRVETDFPDGTLTSKQYSPGPPEDEGFYERSVEATNTPSTGQDGQMVKNQATDEQNENAQGAKDARIPVTAVIDEEKETVEEAEVSYAEFPTHINLREANDKYAKKRKNIPKNADGTLRPFPGYRRKSDIFKKEKFAELDKYAEQTPHSMMRQPIEEIVKYLNKKCRTELEKARAYFWWLATRDLNNLIPLDGESDHENAVLKRLYELKGTQGSDYTQFYAEMCRLGGLQVHIIQGKVRTKCTLESKIEIDNFVNDWLAVAINNEWRLVDIYFALIKGTGGGPGDWELIDDNGKGYRKVETAPQGITYEFDEFYFLADPEHFIYNHRPFLDEWQLLARPVTMAEFQEMAFVKQAFFQNDLAIGSHVKYLLQSSDGEIEIDLNLQKQKRYRFMYHLWRSTKSGKLQSFEGFELSQFVLLQQINDQLHCKVVFPASGDYKVDIFVRTEEENEEEEEDTTYAQACAYIIQCQEARQEWNALPRNSRNEWGLSHEMCDLGLVPLTHPDAIIETDDGNLEIKFKCTKDPVNCLVNLRGQKASEEELEQCILSRQNENKELVIYAKLPERGLYALDIFGKWWGAEGTFPHISTYLIASTTAAFNTQPFPKINNQMSGEDSRNIQMKLQPKSHQSSVVIVTTAEEQKLEFITPLKVDVTTNLYHWIHNSTEECTEYSFISLSNEAVDFLLRFVNTGTYTFDIFAKPCGTEGTYPKVYTFVFFVLQSNPEWVPFPKAFGKWGPGYQIEGLLDGHVQAGEQRAIKMVVPDAEKVAVVTEDNEWQQLNKDDDNNWEGDIDVGKVGKMNVYANYGEGNNYNAFLECEVKSPEQLEKEKQERIRKEKELQESLNKKKKEEDEKKRRLEKQFEDTRKELLEAIESRDLEKIRKAIAKVERNNYTKRLDKEYKEAKELKKSLDKIARLRKLVLSMDQKMMAVIRSYTNPPPLVHDVMRATFLILGNGLKETKSWKRCQALSNTIELNKRIRAFDIRHVPNDTAKTSRNILDPIRIEDVQSTSDGAATFYIWTLGMTEEIMLFHRK